MANRTSMCDDWPMPDLIPGDGEVFKFLNVWLWFAIAGISIVNVLGYLVFKKYYINPSYETWRWKTNPVYPTPEMVKNEILKSSKGAVVATFFPALSLYLVLSGSEYTQGYCGMTEEKDLTFHLKQLAVIWIAADFYESFYHHLGHTFEMCWEQHKSHHQFFNPTPFAVIADDFVDQVFRAFPMFIFPVLMPINIEMMYAQWGSMFYIYGIYLHWGYESHFISAHNPVLNTAYDHHLHHRLSIKNKAIRTGFFFKIWDSLFGNVPTGECFCVRCQHAQGKRELADFKKIQIPDYSVLASPSFWLAGEKKTKAS